MVQIYLFREIWSGPCAYYTIIASPTPILPATSVRGRGPWPGCVAAQFQVPMMPLPPRAAEGKFELRGKAHQMDAQSLKTENFKGSFTTTTCRVVDAKSIDCANTKCKF